MLRKIIACGAAAAALGILAFWLWPRPRVNVLLITLDTTRADRLGCYGYAGAKTPVLDALAASGVLCEHAYTVAPLTLPAHTSLFTGLYPAEHGVRSNGRGRLDDSIPTLAQVLRRHGYDTGAFVASFVLDRKFGLARGFKTYDDEIADDGSPAELHHRERDGQSVVDAALAWLREKRSGPFFCWVHLYDPHAPYLTHQDLFGNAFADHPYDAEIAYVDQQVERLLTFLKQQDLDAQTLVVVVGDHGEGLGEHVERKHGMTLYDAVLHVPLLFRFPGRLIAGRRVPGRVSLVDLSPSLLDLLGLPDFRGTTGKSIAARLRGNPSPDRSCYAATDEPFLNNGWSPLRSLTEGQWKYIRTSRPELYDLANDAGEQHNLIDAEPHKAREMESRLTEFESRLVLHSSAGVQLRPDERRALESLGYLGVAKPGLSSAPEASLPDVKDMLATEVAVDDAGELVSHGEVELAIERLRKIASEVPAHSKAHCYLADALRHQKKYDEAESVLRSYLQTKSEAPEAHYGLALVMLEQGRDDAAVPELTTTLALDPEYAEAHYDLAMIHIRRDEPDHALAEFDAALQIDHCHGAAYTERGTLLARLGRIAEAIADLQQGLKFAPRSPSLHNNLGFVLSGTGATEEARQHLERAVELSPDSAEFRYTLGSFLLSQREFEKAIAHLARAVELNPEFRAAQDRLRDARGALGQTGP
jgi:arylsulfatase A-like enzyme/Tfp pilus assembly protein PilF